MNGPALGKVTLLGDGTRLHARDLCEVTAEPESSRHR